jgi:peptidoglycan-associated lipoprotein
MQSHKKNSKPIFSSFKFSICLLFISLPFLGSCLGPQTTLSEDQIAKKNILASVIESKAPAAVNSDDQKDSVDFSTALGLPIEASQNKTSSLTESSNLNTTKRNDWSTSIVEETFESNQKELPSSIKERLKNSTKKTDRPSVTQWELPNPDGSSEGIEIAKTPPLYPTQKLNDIYFDFDAFKLDQKSKAVLQINGKWLSQNPNVKLEIHGHCDERGTNNYNLGLGEKRALTVKNFLAANGIESSRINTISFGEEKPFCFEKSDDCWKQNRRAHFLISKKSL